MLHYEGAPPPASDPKLAKPPLNLGCAYGRPAPGVIDFKLTTLPPAADVRRAPSAAAAQHTGYLIDKAAEGLGQNRKAVLGSASSRPFNMTRAVSVDGPCASKYCWCAGVGGTKHGCCLLMHVGRCSAVKALDKRFV